jgi:hypothetical protein
MNMGHNDMDYECDKKKDAFLNVQQQRTESIYPEYAALVGKASCPIAIS